MIYIITYTERTAITHGEGTDYSYTEGREYKFSDLGVATDVFNDMQLDEECSDIMRNF
tara:strand:+ start:1262 stop:1435 length:174 start_codon:yes stop_codon:yes gene_type:complete